MDAHGSLLIRNRAVCYPNRVLVVPVSASHQAASRATATKRAVLGTPVLDVSFRRSKEQSAAA
jgi:hypothetical protein